MDSVVKEDGGDGGKGEKSALGHLPSVLVSFEGVLWAVQVIVETPIISQEQPITLE